MAHIPMEPPAALANYADGKLEIWAPVQSPYGTRQDVAEYTGVPIEDVRVNVTLLGGGFGRKSKCDYVHEAAKLSMEVGAPVRVQWTRQDDVQHSFYHTTSAERIEVALDADNKPTGHALPKRRSVDPLDLRRGQRLPVLHRIRHGLCRHAVRDREHPLRKRSGDGAHQDRLVPLRLQHPSRLGGPVLCMQNSLKSLARIKRTRFSS